MKRRVLWRWKIDDVILLGLVQWLDPYLAHASLLRKYILPTHESKTLFSTHQSKVILY
jgi:hypothetical protein